MTPVAACPYCRRSVDENAAVGVLVIMPQYCAVTRAHCPHCGEHVEPVWVGTWPHLNELRFTWRTPDYVRYAAAAAREAARGRADAAYRDARRAAHEARRWYPALRRPRAARTREEASRVVRAGAEPGREEER